MKIQLIDLDSNANARNLCSFAEFLSQFNEIQGKLLVSFPNKQQHKNSTNKILNISVIGNF